MERRDTRIRQIAVHYSTQAEGFAHFQAPILRELSARLVPALPLAGAHLIVEVGVGTGGLTANLRAAAPGATVVGVDLAEGMLRVARRDQGVPVAVMDAHDLGLAPSVADVAVAAFLLHRTAEPTRVVAEIGRVLQAGGVLGTVTWSHGGRSIVGDIWWEVLRAAGATAEPLAIDRGATLDTPEKMEALARSAGLTDVVAWVVRYERTSTPAEWLAAEVAYGSRRALDRLPVTLRKECVARARERIDRLPAEAFVVRYAAVLCTARKRP